MKEAMFPEIQTSFFTFTKKAVIIYGNSVQCSESCSAGVQLYWTNVLEGEEYMACLTFLLNSPNENKQTGSRWRLVSSLLFAEVKWDLL